MIGTAVVAALPVSGGVANAPSGDFATGGGQLAGDLSSTSSDPSGTTVAFTAQRLASGGVQGEVQIVEPPGPFGRPFTQHGTVECMNVTGNQAVILYRIQAPQPSNDLDQLYVRDNGEGPADDLIVLDRAATAPCALPGSTGSNPLLGRGNVEVHDAE